MNRLALTALLVVLPGQAMSQQSLSVSRAPFGTLPDGRAVELFTLTNAHGVEIRAMTYGEIITAIYTPDRNGRRDDIVLGFDSVAGHLSGAAPFWGHTSERDSGGGP